MCCYNINYYIIPILRQVRFIVRLYALGRIIAALHYIFIHKWRRSRITIKVNLSGVCEYIYIILCGYNNTGNTKYLI